MWVSSFLLNDNYNLGEVIKISKNRKILRVIILAVLLICTAFLVYSIVTNPFGEHDIMLALAVTAGFIALGDDKVEKWINLGLLSRLNN